MKNLKHSHDSFDPEQNNRSQGNNKDQEKKQIDVEKLWDSAKKNASSKITYVKSSKINVTEEFYEGLTELFFGFAFATDINLSQEESNYIRSKMLELGLSAAKFKDIWDEVYSVFNNSLGDDDKLINLRKKVFEYAIWVGIWLDDNPQSNYSKQDVVDTLVELANIDGNVDEVEQVIIDFLNEDWSLSKRGSANKHSTTSKEKPKVKPKPVKKQEKSKKNITKASFEKELLNQKESKTKRTNKKATTNKRSVKANVTKNTKSIPKKTKAIPKKEKKPLKETIEVKKKSNPIYMVLGGLLILSIAGFFIYENFYAPFKKDKEATRKYIIANTYKLRSSRYLNENDLNIIKTFGYGQEVLVYNEDTEWAEVKIIDKYANQEYTGFFGFPQRYLTSKKDFYEMEGLWGNEDARKLITQSYAKKAVIDYLQMNNLMTDVPANIQDEIYNERKNKQVWQIYGIPIVEKYDVAVSNENVLFTIITEKENKDNKKLLIFSFNEEKDYKDKLLFDQKIDPEYDGMRVVKKGSKFYLGKESGGKRVKSKLKYDAIELGNIVAAKLNKKPYKTAIVFSDEKDGLKMVIQ